MRRLSLTLLLAAAAALHAPALPAQAAADSALARDVRVQTDSVRAGYSTYYAKLHRLIGRIDSLVGAHARAATPQPPADTSAPPPADSTTPPPSGPPPAADTSSHEPAGMTLLTDRQWRSKAKAADDQAGAEYWDPGMEWNKGNLSILTDPTTPGGDAYFARMTYPAGMSAGVAPAAAQIMSSRWATGKKVREVFVTLWVRLSQDFYGNQSSTNKIFFLWIAGGARFFISAEGAGMNRLIPQIRLQGKYIPDTRPRLLPNVRPGTTLKRGVWQKWELRVVANTPGQFDGIIQWWLDGQLISDYRDVAFVAAGESNLWEQFQWSPTYGGGGSGPPYPLTLDFARSRIVGR